MPKKILNLYAGLGGNRKHWKGVKVTAVENNPHIAALYLQQFPKDEIIVADAHDYLLKNYKRFDGIWSSPPCQSHSNLQYTHTDKVYPDMRLYEEIILLKHLARVPWVVENVKAYYAPLIPAQLIGRHNFWSNKVITPVNVPVFPGFDIGGSTEQIKAQLKWTGLNLSYKELYGIDGKRPIQLIRNCVHPALGLHVLKSILK